MLRARSGGDLLPTGVRGPAAAAVALATAVATFLAVRFGGTGPQGMGSLDRALFRERFLGRSGLELLIVIGMPATVIALAVAGAVTAFWRGRRRLAVLTALGPALTGVATTLLKPVIGRTIADGEFAYPSGHTAGAAALGLVAAIAVLSTIHARRPMAMALLAASIVPAAIAGTGMVLLGAHYATDVIGGYATAVTAVLGTALALDAAARCIQRAQEADE